MFTSQQKQTILTSQKKIGLAFLQTIQSDIWQLRSYVPYVFLTAPIHAKGYKYKYKGAFRSLFFTRISFVSQLGQVSFFHGTVLIQSQLKLINQFVTI